MTKILCPHIQPLAIRFIARREPIAFIIDDTDCLNCICEYIDIPHLYRVIMKYEMPNDNRTQCCQFFRIGGSDDNG